MTFGSVRFGTVRSGSGRSSPDRIGSVRSGSVRFGSVRIDRFGSVRFGLVRIDRFGSKNSMQASLRRVIHFLNVTFSTSFGGSLLALVTESTRAPRALLWAPAPRLRSSQCASGSQQRVKTHP